ncbi:MAG: superoxide dismutase, partial [Christiangramia sp.]|nr:superoxide dismutase [Christiangramia sp.]
MSFELPKLKYAFDALEPHIDARTMEIHHGKHHAGYTKKLNAAVEGTDMEGKNIENILKNLDMSNKAVRNNGGGFYNHSLYWEIMSPDGGGKPEGELAKA